MTIDFDKVTECYKELKGKEKDLISRGEFPHKVIYYEFNYAEHLELKRLCRKKGEKKIKKRRRIAIPIETERITKKVPIQKEKIVNLKKNDSLSLVKKWVEKIRGRKKQ